MTEVTLTVNGARRTVDVEPRRLLCDVLRQDLDCLGVHFGCSHGACGCCTVRLKRQARALLPPVRGAVRGRGDHHGGRTREERGIAPAATSLHRRARVAVRVLYSGLHHGAGRFRGTRKAAERCRDSPGHVGKHLPLHGLPDHRQRGAARDRRPEGQPGGRPGRRRGTRWLRPLHGPVTSAPASPERKIPGWSPARHAIWRTTLPPVRCI